MNEALAVGYIVVGGVALIAFITPIIKLNTSITKLTTTIECLDQDNKERDRRLTIHGDQIDELSLTAGNHEVRIKHLEQARHSTAIQKRVE